MTITMYDAITVANLPDGAEAYAGYVDGRWQTFPLLQRKFPSAHLLDIAVFASGDATCLDVEAGDATIDQIYGWFKRQQARKVWRPVVYSSVSNIDHIVATMTANGFPRSSYRLWSAHYAAGEHICGPATCRITGHPCDGTQWTSQALGRDLDQSILGDGFFPAPKPAPDPQPATVKGEIVPALLLQTTDGQPVALPDGATSVRFFSNVKCSLRVDTRVASGPQTLTVDLDYDAAKKVDVPDGIHGLVVHRAESVAQISYAVSL